MNWQIAYYIQQVAVIALAVGAYIMINVLFPRKREITARRRTVR